MGIGLGAYFLFATASGCAVVFYRAMYGNDETSEWLRHLHGDFFLRSPGVILNAVGGAFLILVCLTGAVIWWPGIRNWRKSLTVPTAAERNRFTWRLHSATGFWTFGLVLMFPITGAVMVFSSEPSTRMAGATGLAAVLVDVWLFFRKALGVLHGGPSVHWAIQAVWGVLGLPTLLLIVTGTLVWWNRRTPGQGSR